MNQYKTIPDGNFKNMIVINIGINKAIILAFLSWAG
jgi:hypothetical protein